MPFFYGIFEVSQYQAPRILTKRKSPRRKKKNLSFSLNFPVFLCRLHNLGQNVSHHFKPRPSIELVTDLTCFGSHSSPQRTAPRHWMSPPDGRTLQKGPWFVFAFAYIFFIHEKQMKSQIVLAENHWFKMKNKMLSFI